jgi:flagellar biosynthesis protein FlhG
VTVPEPPAIEATYRFLRAAFRRKLKRTLVRDKLRSAILERAMTELGTLPAPIDLVHKLAKMDRPLAELAWAQCAALRVQLVVNQTRVRTDVELGSWMSGLVSRHYGVSLDELGHVEHDDTVWLTVRRNKPLLVDSPASKSARNIERIARRVVALAGVKGSGAPESVSPIPMEEPTLYAVLGLTRSATDEEVRRAYKRQREVYAAGGLATASLLDEEQLARAGRKLEEAYDTLLDAVRRRAYDLSTFPEPGPRGRAADAPGAAPARDRARHRVHREPAAQGARVAGHRADGDQQQDEDREDPPSSPRGRPVRGLACDRLHARVPHRAGEAAASRPGARA